MELGTMKLRDRDAELFRTLKSKVKGGHDNANMCAVYIDSLANGKDLQIQLIDWLRSNPDSTADEVSIYWQTVRPERDEDFDYDTLLDDE